MFMFRQFIVTSYYFENLYIDVSYTNFITMLNVQKFIFRFFIFCSVIIVFIFRFFSYSFLIDPGKPTLNQC